jgi:hypothetical protein
MGRTLASFGSKTRSKNILLDGNSPYLSLNSKKVIGEKCQILLARPERFELPTPRFVVYTTALIWHDFSANPTPK